MGKKKRQLFDSCLLKVNLTGLYPNHLLVDIDNILKVLNDI